MFFLLQHQQMSPKLKTKRTLPSRHGRVRLALTGNTCIGSWLRLQSHYGGSRKRLACPVCFGIIHSYRIAVALEFKLPESLRRVFFAVNGFKSLLPEYSDILDATCFSDEAWFHLPGYVKLQDMYVSTAADLHATLEEPVLSQDVAVLRALSAAELAPCLPHDHPHRPILR